MLVDASSLSPKIEAPTSAAAAPHRRPRAPGAPGVGRRRAPPSPAAALLAETGHQDGRWRAAPRLEPTGPGCRMILDPNSALKANRWHEADFSVSYPMIAFYDQNWVRDPDQGCQRGRLRPAAASIPSHRRAPPRVSLVHQLVSRDPPEVARLVHLLPVRVEPTISHVLELAAPLVEAHTHRRLAAPGWTVCVASASKISRSHPVVMSNSTSKTSPNSAPSLVARWSRWTSPGWTCSSEPSHRGSARGRVSAAPGPAPRSPRPAPAVILA
jgi:hypothetical protein